MSGSASFTSMLGPTIEQYLALKEALGRRYAVERKILQHLDQFLATGGHGHAELTCVAFDSWCQTLQHLCSGVRRNRMRVVRNLCLYRRRTMPACFVPDLSQFPSLHQPIRPYIFTETDIVRLLRLTDTLDATSGSPIRREVFRLAVVLLYTSGLRRSELLHLTLGDYDPREQTLLVRASKFHKSRLMPLSADGAREIEAYLKVRRTHRLPAAGGAPLLCNSRRDGGAYSGEGFAHGIRALLHAAGIRTAEGHLPRVHDFRHSFAVRALVRWYGAGADVQAKLPFLAAYMGHVSIASTEYYLSFVEPLASAASERFAQHCGALVRALRATGGTP